MAQIDAAQQEHTPMLRASNANRLQKLRFASLLSKRFSLLGKFPDLEVDNQ